MELDRKFKDGESTSDPNLLGEILIIVIILIGFATIALIFQFVGN